MGKHPATSADLALESAMPGYWTRFAETGDPNGGGAAVWPTYDPAADTYLELDVPLTSGKGVRTERCDFWESLAL